MCIKILNDIHFETDEAFKYKYIGHRELISIGRDNA